MWEGILDFYDKLVATNTKFKRLGKTMPYTSANTYVFSLLNKDGEIGIRLPKESQKEFKDKHNATEFRSYGAIMKNYVKIPEELYDDMDVLTKYLDERYEYFMSLPPQPRKKK